LEHYDADPYARIDEPEPSKDTKGTLADVVSAAADSDFAAMPTSFLIIAT